MGYYTTSLGYHYIFNIFFWQIMDYGYSLSNGRNSCILFNMGSISIIYLIWIIFHSCTPIMQTENYMVHVPFCFLFFVNGHRMRRPDTPKNKIYGFRYLPYLRHDDVNILTYCYKMFYYQELVLWYRIMLKYLPHILHYYRSFLLTKIHTLSINSYYSKKFSFEIVLDGDKIFRLGNK